MWSMGEGAQTVLAGPLLDQTTQPAAWRVSKVEPGVAEAARAAPAQRPHLALFAASAGGQLPSQLRSIE